MLACAEQLLGCMHVCVHVCSQRVECNRCTSNSVCRSYRGAFISVRHVALLGVDQPRPYVAAEPTPPRVQRASELCVCKLGMHAVDMWSRRVFPRLANSFLCPNCFCSLEWMLGEWSAEWQPKHEKEPVVRPLPPLCMQAYV
jgi:hypothetical protein